MLPDNEREIEIYNSRGVPGIEDWALPRVRCVLESAFSLASYFLEVHLVTLEESAEINWESLRHEGPTDVITLDYGESATEDSICGALYICPDIAEEYAAIYQETHWREILRYVVHGILHLLGHDDQTDKERQSMRENEDRALAVVDRAFG